MKCSKCGAKIDDNQFICPVCGDKIEEVIESPINDENIFSDDQPEIIETHANFTSSQIPQTPKKVSVNKTTKKGHKKFIVIIIICILLIAAVLTAVYFCMGTLNLTSTPSGASVYIDENFVGVTPLIVNNLMIGTHVVRLEKSDYHIWTGKITINSKSTTTQSITMTPLTGSLYISSNSGSAAVYVDGTYKGTTPLSLSNLNVGSHTIKLVKSGYSDWVQMVTIISGQTINKLATMTQLSGSLSITSTPTGALLYVDGVYQGTTPITVNRILIGRHVIKLVKSGYDDWAESLTIVSGQTTSKTAMMNPSTGSLYVSSNPAAASIYIDGIYKGTTPLTVSNLQVGSHTIKLIKSGYDNWAQTLTITSGQTLSKSATLTSTNNIVVQKTGFVSDYSLLLGRYYTASFLVQNQGLGTVNNIHLYIKLMDGANVRDSTDVLIGTLKSGEYKTVSRNLDGEFGVTYTLSWSTVY